MDGIERRLRPKVEVSWPVTMLTSEGSMQGETRDISMQGGIYLLRQASCSLGEVCAEC